MVLVPYHLIECVRHQLYGYLIVFFYLVSRALFIAASITIAYAIIVDGIPISDLTTLYFNDEFGDILWLIVKVPVAFAAVVLVAHKIRIISRKRINNDCG